MTKALLWSGGLDSTVLLLNTLTAMSPTDRLVVLSVDLKNNEAQGKAEAAARQRLIPLMRSAYEAASFELNPLSRTQFFEASVDVPYRGGSWCLIQPQIWAFMALYLADSDVEEISIGYVANDDALAFLDDIRNIWNSYAPLWNHSTPMPKLTFPLVKVQKETLIFRYLAPPTWPDRWVYAREISWCEWYLDDKQCVLRSTTTEIMSRASKSCPSCRRMAAICLDSGLDPQVIFNPLAAFDPGL